MLYLKCCRHNKGKNFSYFVASDLLYTAFGTENAFNLIKKEKGGKPYIEGANYDFSIADTKGAVVVAVTGDGKIIPDVFCIDKICKKIGVDIEWADRVVSEESMARVLKKMYSEKEREYVSAGTAGCNRRFLEIWTKKESIVKATGQGLSAIRRTDTLRFDGKFLETKYIDIGDETYIVSFAGI